MHQLDARARYTRQVIEDSFLSLLKEKPAAKITVTELCQLAGINRATFYKHYADIPALLDHMTEDMLAQLQAFLDSRPRDQFDAMILDVMRFLQQSWQRYFLLGSDNGNPTLFSRSFWLSYRSSYPALEQNLPDLEPEQIQMLYYYLAQGCGGIVAYWFRSGASLPPETVAQMIVDAAASTVRGFQTQRRK